MTTVMAPLRLILNVAVFRSGVSGNMLFYPTPVSCICKRTFVRYLLERKIIKAETTEEVLKGAVQHTLEEYRKCITQSNRSVQESEDTAEKSSNTTISNSSVSALLTNYNDIVVAFSGNKDVGFLAHYVYDRKSGNFLYCQGHFLQDNNNVYGRKATLHENPGRNSQLKNDIYRMHNEMKKKNRKKFLKEIKTRNIDDLFAKLGQPPGVGKIVLADLKKIVNREGQLPAKYILGIIGRFLENQVIGWEKNLETRETQLNEIESRWQRVQEGKVKLSEEAKRELESKKEEAQRKVESARETLNKLESEIYVIIAEIVRTLFKHVRASIEQLPPFDPTSCAEIHAISALVRMPNERSKSIFVKMKSLFVRTKVEYMATYRTSDMTPAVRCANCRMSTAHIPNVITDREWSQKLQELRKRAAKSYGSALFDWLYGGIGKIKKFRQITLNE